MNDHFVSPTLVAWWTTLGFLYLAAVVHFRLNRRQLFVTGLCALAASAAGIVLRGLVRVTFRGLANDASIAVLTIVLTVVAAYGVYIAQNAESKSRRTEVELRLIEAERRKIAELHGTLESALKTQAEALDEAQRRGQILSLKQTILAGMPDNAADARALQSHVFIRRIVLDAVSREDATQALFDCDEAVSAAESNNIELSEVLGKGSLAFLEFHRLMRLYANTGT